MIAVAAPAALAGQTGWAHQDAAFTSNGAVTVKGLAGGTYTGTQNPTGAVAKANQSAATQPPTVIIQATSTSFQQTYPMVVVGTSTIPSCPTGYSSLWSTSSPAVNVNGINKPVYNVGGSRFTFGAALNSGNYYIGFFSDSIPTTDQGGSPFNIFSPATYWGNGGSTNSFAANLCTK